MKIVFSIVLAAIATPATLGGIEVWEVGDGGNGHAYEFVAASGIQWWDADAAAESMTLAGFEGGHLVSITSADENLFVQSLIPDGAIEAWIGGFQVDPNAAPDATWAWTTGESFDYLSWDSDEPNNHGDGEQYLGMWGSAGDGPLGQWNDQGNAAGTDPFIGANIAGYLVEYDVPAPATSLLLAMLIGRGRSRRRS